MSTTWQRTVERTPAWWITCRIPWSFAKERNEINHLRFHPAPTCVEFHFLSVFFPWILSTFSQPVDRDVVNGRKRWVYHMFYPAVFPLCVLPDGDEVHVRIRRLVALNGDAGADVGVQVKGLPQQQIHWGMTGGYRCLQRTCGLERDSKLLEQNDTNIIVDISHWNVEQS